MQVPQLLRECILYGPCNSPSRIEQGPRAHPARVLSPPSRGGAADSYRARDLPRPCPPAAYEKAVYVGIVTSACRLGSRKTNLPVPKRRPVEPRRDLLICQGVYCMIELEFVYSSKCEPAGRHARALATYLITVALSRCRRRAALCVEKGGHAMPSRPCPIPAKAYIRASSWRPSSLQRYLAPGAGLLPAPATPPPPEK